MATSYDLKIQTVFTPPPACSTAGVTRMAISSFELWNNAIVPAPSITETSCYPSQFWSSALATSSLAPLEQLICPRGWGTYDVNSTYIICCPKGISASMHQIYTMATVPLHQPTALPEYTRICETGHGTYVLATPFDGTAASTTYAVSTPNSSSTVQTTSSPTTTTTPMVASSETSSSSTTDYG
ncbi:Hypothetical protein R9X50_00418600 [Acrodontium crateriforme]|uniref:Uncharacterized protein n=1 Tax=Acrodontium crateriforme TaxID=150365 RepID=A0AAQ3M4V1_9PEZI|nr:Hypothetical protein R9X50_00418600 [Acrodontium crateriforme]